MGPHHPLFDTLDTIFDGQVPNFLRLYLNPYVAQTCFCLSRYARSAWPTDGTPVPEYQSFLANSLDEALSGAIKLARYRADPVNDSAPGLIIDPEDRMGPFVSVAIDRDHAITFIPDLIVGRNADPGQMAGKKFGFVVVFIPADEAASVPDVAALRDQGCAPLVIACVNRRALLRYRANGPEWWTTLRPDIVVFDESFVNRHVPFGAFTAQKHLYGCWNRSGTATFHSTTFQPNALTSLHFLRCTQRDDPKFFASVSAELGRIARDASHRKSQFARLYNPSLARTIAAIGWDHADVSAAGHYISVDDQQVFDGVGGVACSVRGHNPSGYREEIQKLANVSNYQEAAAQRLQELTGLGNLLPAVSGASAVENALRLGLVAQYPRKHVLALKGGFGGKTLLALTGTAKDSYKTRIAPLYPDVLYIDPFAESAINDLEAAFARYPVGVVELELIQAVGGVRAVPDRVIQYLQEAKQRHGYLLFVDEVQTGMYRTGPFLRSRELGVAPDLLTIGKGTSDMVFPFAATLYSDAVRARLQGGKSSLANAIRQRYDYEFGYKTVINILDRGRELDLSNRVAEQSARFRQLLTEGLASCRAVRSIRVYGLLIAIELESHRWLRKQAGALYGLSLLRHRPFPVFMGFCQYEPHVLKFTPPLTITGDEVERVCETIVTVLRRPSHQLLPPFLGAMARSFIRGKWEGYRNRRCSHECAAR